MLGTTWENRPVLKARPYIDEDDDVLLRVASSSLPVRRCDAEEMSGEEIEPLVLAVSPARPMAGTGDDEEIEILVVFIG